MPSPSTKRQKNFNLIFLVDFFFKNMINYMASIRIRLQCFKYSYAFNFKASVENDNIKLKTKIKLRNIVCFCFYTIFFLLFLWLNLHQNTTQKSEYNTYEVNSHMTNLKQNSISRFILHEGAYFRKYIFPKFSWKFLFQNKHNLFNFSWILIES